MLASTSAAGPPPGSGDQRPRIDLRVLVLDDGSRSVGAIRAALEQSGTPYRAVDLNAPGRQDIDADFLTGTDPADGDRPWAHYQGVVAPNEAPPQLSAAEARALADFRARFDIPQVDAAARPSPRVGLAAPADHDRAGAVDGLTAQVTAAGGGDEGPFGYLEGTIAFDDLTPGGTGSRGAVAAPAVAAPLDTLPEGESYTSLLAAPLPGSDAEGSLIGEYVHDGGLRDLVVTFDIARHQRQFSLLSRGVLDWLTDGVRLGQQRYFFSVHVDDVLADDARWSVEDDCTQGDPGCPATIRSHPPIRMTSADAAYAAGWQEANGLYLDIAYNAGLGEEWREENGGDDPLADQLVGDSAAYRWLNHTYTHAFLGCLRDESVSPWQCRTDDSGEIRWVSQQTIVEEIQRNIDWAAANGVALDATELVTGEHGGLAAGASQPEDNPNLAPALTETGVEWIASDNSIETQQRPVGEAVTVPRHPMDIYYNAGTEAEEVDLYNWIYTSAADGGSGACDAGDWCLPAPLDLDTGFEDYIVPHEADVALEHVLNGDPRPHYVHQSNIAEDRLLYPVLDELLAAYDELFDENTPLVNPTQREAGEELSLQTAWRRALDEDRVTAYRVGDTVTVTVEAADGAAAGDVAVPATVPGGTAVLEPDGDAVPFATAYAGARSGWATPKERGGVLTLTLDAAAQPAGAAR